jgi:hypothetical protein
MGVHHRLGPGATFDFQKPHVFILRNQPVPAAFTGFWAQARAQNPCSGFSGPSVQIHDAATKAPYRTLVHSSENRKAQRIPLLR